MGSAFIQTLYREIGEVIQKRFSNWRMTLLAPSQAPLHLLALKTDRVIDLMNGAIPVKLLLANQG